MKEYCQACKTETQRAFFGGGCIPCKQRKSKEDGRRASEARLTRAGRYASGGKTPSELREENIKRYLELYGDYCKRCGKTYPFIVYDLHHTNPDNKTAGGSKLLNMQWDKVQEELSQCELLCANCHRLEHC